MTETNTVSCQTSFGCKHAANHLTMRVLPYCYVRQIAVTWKHLSILFFTPKQVLKHCRKILLINSITTRVVLGILEYNTFTTLAMLLQLNVGSN